MSPNASGSGAGAGSGGHRAIRDLGRRKRLAATLNALGDTEAGRSFGLLRLASLDDFRASVPLMDAATHAEKVTARLGFGLDGLDGEQLTAASVQRRALRAVWRQRLGGGRPSRIAVLAAPADDPHVDALRLDDLRSLGGSSGGEVLDLRRTEWIAPDPEQTLDELRRFRPDALVIPSLATCGWFEQVIRTPLERRLPQLRWLFAEHDLDERIRCRLPVINTGWIHDAGRIGLPAARSPFRAFGLATRSTLIELLPHGDPEIDPRRDPHEQTILPEAAILGERYELVLSSPLGFLRLRSGLHVRVVGFNAPLIVPGLDGARDGARLEDSLPCPRVVRLPPPPRDAALEGVTVPGAWLTAGVRQAFLPEDPALIAADVAPDPDAVDVSARGSRTGMDPFADTELGASRAGTRRKGPKPRSLAVRVEVQGQASPSFAMQIAERVDVDLRRRSPAYEWLRSRDELWEPRVVIARPGTAQRGRERRIRALWGPVDRPVVQTS